MDRTVPITPKLGEYIRSVTVREPEVLRRLREETASHPHARMQVSPEQGQFMSLLARLAGARRALEIGVFTGYSSLAVALALPEDGRLVACDISAKVTAVARRYWQAAGVEHKIDLRVAPALETLDALIAAGEADAYDFAFIDADKENYQNYLERCLVLLRQGGLMVVDNVLWHGSVVDPSMNDADTLAIREFNRRLHRDERVVISLVPIDDGLTLALKK
jgi:caffeoyl-CoA O-methyltransferase